MTTKYHIHTLQTNPRHREEESLNTYSHKASRTQTARSLFPIKMIAKLERTLSTTHNKTNRTQSPNN